MPLLTLSITENEFEIDPAARAIWSKRKLSFPFLHWKVFSVAVRILGSTISLRKSFFFVSSSEWVPILQYFTLLVPSSSTKSAFGKPICRQATSAASFEKLLSLFAKKLCVSVQKWRKSRLDKKPQRNRVLKTLRNWVLISELSFL